MTTSRWTGFHMLGMVFHMKTTLMIPDRVFAEIKREAARQKATLSEVVEVALRLYLQRVKEHPKPPSLGSFHGGRLLVDISDREKLYDFLDSEEPTR